VVEGFGNLTADNRRIITMEWIAEGVALISTATFVAAVTAIQPGGLASQAVYAVAIVTLLAFAVVSLCTGFKVAFLPFKLCPFIYGGGMNSEQASIWNMRTCCPDVKGKAAWLSHKARVPMQGTGADCLAVAMKFL
jgi:hypothetical protein